MTNYILMLKRNHEKMKLYIQTIHPNETPASIVQETVYPRKQPRLSKLEINVFDGAASSWLNFNALFTSAIHKHKSMEKSRLKN